MKTHDLIELVGVLLVVVGFLTGIAAAALVSVALAVTVAALSLILGGVVLVFVAAAAERDSESDRT